MSPVRNSDPHKRLADIFSKMKHSTQRRLMNDLKERDADSAEQVQALMFVFEDLTRIEPRGIQELLRQTEQGQLAIALKGVSSEVKNLFFDNMSERAGKLLRDNMDAMGPVRMSEVEKAQTAIVSTAKSLADAGKITIRQDEDDEYVL